MWIKFLFWLSGKLRCRLINIDNKPYLERYYIGKIRWLGLTFYLHRFVGGDGDRNVHDHPWKSATSFILTGGYREELVKAFDPVSGWVSEYVERNAPALNRLGPLTFHRIDTIKPETWTLFVTRKRFKGWGFLYPPKHEKQCTAYNQPYEVTQFKGWYRNALTGAEMSREELGR